MKTYSEPAIEFAQFNHVNIITESITVNKDGNTNKVGAPDRYDDDDDF